MKLVNVDFNEKKNKTLGELESGTIVALKAEQFDRDFQDHEVPEYKVYMLLNSWTDHYLRDIVDFQTGNVFTIDDDVIPEKVFDSEVNLQEV